MRKRGETLATTIVDDEEDIAIMWTRQCVRALLFLAALLPICSSLQAQTRRQAPAQHRCHVYAVDLTEADKLRKELLARPNPKPEEFREAAKKVQKILGMFRTQVGEELVTNRSFQFPETGSVVTATVFYTDEMMDLSESMLQGLYIGKAAVENAIQAPGAAVTEVNYEMDTYKIRTKQRIVIEGKPWAVGLECQCMSREERRKQLDAAQRKE